jgi:hypothetical protein
VQEVRGSSPHGSVTLICVVGTCRRRSSEADQRSHAGVDECPWPAASLQRHVRSRETAQLPARSRPLSSQSWGDRSDEGHHTGDDLACGWSRGRARPTPTGARCKARRARHGCYANAELSMPAGPSVCDVRL